jgi:alpha-1,2-mannosyltransferase
MPRLRAVPPHRWRVAFAAALATVLLLAGARYAAKIDKASVLGTQTRSAFLRWRAQIVGDVWPDGRPVPGLMQGADPYLLYNYPNPTIMALVLWPLFELPPVAGALAWFALKVGMAALLVLWAFRLAAPPGRPLPDPAMAAAILLGLHPILGDLSHGNVNIFIAFLVLGGLELFRRRLDVACGLTLGLAVACKVTPALLFPYLVWKRAWRAAAAMLVGVGLWLVVVPGAALGWERNTTLLTHWFDGMVRPFLIDGQVTSEHANQSIPGVVARLLTAQPSDLDYDEDGKPVPKTFHNVADIGPVWAKRVARGCQAVFALAVVTLCWAPVGPGAKRQGPRFAAEVSLVLLGMLLFSERTWKHHAVTLVVPYAVIAGLVAAGGIGPGVRRYLIGTLGAVAVLAFGPSLLGGDAQDAALAYGSHTAVFLLLAAAMCAVMWYERAANASPEPLPS